MVTWQDEEEEDRVKALIRKADEDMKFIMQKVCTCKDVSCLYAIYKRQLNRCFSEQIHTSRNCSTGHSRQLRDGNAASKVPGDLRRRESQQVLSPISCSVQWGTPLCLLFSCYV